MDAAQILALIAFGALVVALLLVLRGMGKVLVRTRADEAFRRGLGDVAERASANLLIVLDLADQARYRTATGTELSTAAGTASAVVHELRSEAQKLTVPTDRRADRDAIVGDLRAAAAALVAVAEAATDQEGSPPEARTRLKRGYLALAHAAQSVADHRELLMAERPPTERRRRQR